MQNSFIDQSDADAFVKEQFRSAQTPESARAPLTQVLADLVEADQAEAEFWRGWQALSQEREEILAPLQAVPRLYLYLRQSRTASPVSVHGGSDPAQRYARCRDFLRAQIARLQKPVSSCHENLPFPSATVTIGPEDLPVVSQAPSESKE